MENKYQWKRYWNPPDGKIFFTRDGLLEDPENRWGKFVNSELVDLSTSNETGCLVMLGEPGIGKSIEIEDLCETTRQEKGDEHVLIIDLSEIPSPDIFRDELTQTAQYKSWAERGEPLYLFLDSFDEGMTSSSFKSFAKYFSHLLSQQTGHIPALYLRISCRTAIWQTYFEEDLKKFWNNDNFKKYELCPLTESDVQTALDVHSIDKEHFFSELRAKEIVGLAGKPLTLNLLIDVFRRDGQFPERKSEIYSQGCSLLIEEQDPAKKSEPTSKPTLTLKQKLAVAERIAAATMIGGNPTVSLEGTPQEGEIGLTQLHGTEIVDDTRVTIGDEQIREVLNTGLFSSRGNGKMGWAHQSYGEFLAASYVARHKLEWPQIQSLLFHDPLKIGVFQVVPQLYEVCAWLASLDPTFFDNAVHLDPEFLLLSDANVITDTQRQTLAEELLAKFDKGELFDRWEIYNFTNYKKLNNARLSQQLEPYIVDSTKGIVVRRVATEVAAACEVVSLEPSLVAVALNQDDDLSVRVRAINALARFASDQSRLALKPIITDLKNDPEDELKGAVLRTLWPKHITIEEVLPLITPPKKHNFHGAYNNFIDSDLSESLQAEHVLIGLDWVDKNIDKMRDLEYSRRQLSDAIMLKAWENISIPGALEKFAEIAYNRLKDFEVIVGERALSEEVAAEFQKAIDSQTEDRKKLIKQIIKIILHKDSSPGRKSYVLLHHGSIQLVSSKDTVWLTEWLLEERDAETQKLIAEIIGRVMDIKDPEQTELVSHAREKNSFLKEETHFWFESVELNSDSAKSQKEQWKDQKKWQEQRERDEKEEILKIISTEKIIELLEKSEAGDMDSWWVLNNALCMYQHELDESKFQDMPGWKVIGEEIQNRIIESGKKFISTQECKPEIWLGQGKIYFPALSGYRLIKFVYEREPKYIENQDVEFWKRWAPITLGFPLVSNDPENGKIIALAYKYAPDEIISTLAVLIDDEAQRYDALFINDLLEASLDARLCEFLLEKAQQDHLSQKVKGEILRFLLSHDDPATKEYVKSKITTPLPTEDAEREEVLSSAAFLLWNANSEDWNFLWDLMKKDNDFARALVIRANDSPLRGSSILQNISEVDLADLYIWLVKEFPPEEYNTPEGVHTVTPKISIGDWRDSVLRVLMDKGTAESFVQVERLALALPQYKWIKEFTLLEARRIALQRTWHAPTGDEIFKLVENHELRLVNSPDELMNIVLWSLDSLQRKLQSRSLPRAVDLWDKSKPKDEKALSDYVAAHLQEDIKKHGIVVNREVEIRRGNETDIHISAFGRDHLGRPTGDPMKVTIETKGCWHRDLDTAMESQLIGQYMSTDDCRHGIYLIGWFVCDAWSDRKSQSVPTIDLLEAREKFLRQAKELSEKNTFRVETVILDIRV